MPKQTGGYAFFASYEGTLADLIAENAQVMSTNPDVVRQDTEIEELFDAEIQGGAFDEEELEDRMMELAV